MTVILQVPQQTNGGDCGVYCINFFREFLENPNGICQVAQVGFIILDSPGGLSHNKQVNLKPDHLEHLWAAYRLPQMRKVLKKLVQEQALLSWVTGEFGDASRA